MSLCEFPISSSCASLLQVLDIFTPNPLFLCPYRVICSGISIPAFMAFTEFVLKGAMTHSSLSRKLAIIQNPLFPDKQEFGINSLSLWCVTVYFCVVDTYAKILPCKQYLRFNNNTIRMNWTVAVYVYALWLCYSIVIFQLIQYIWYINSIQRTL